MGVNEVGVTRAWRRAGHLHELQLRGLGALAQHEHADRERLGVGETSGRGEVGRHVEALKLTKPDAFGVEADALVEIGHDRTEVDRRAGEGDGLRSMERRADGEQESDKRGRQGAMHHRVPFAGWRTRPPRPEGEASVVRKPAGAMDGPAGMKSAARMAVFRAQSRKPESSSLRAGACSLRTALASICRIRSRVTLKMWPTSSSV